MLTYGRRGKVSDYLTSQTGGTVDPLELSGVKGLEEI